MTDLTEQLANAIPTGLTATPHVGVGSARRLKIAQAVLPVVEAAIEQGRQEERSKIAADLYAEGDRERERLREWLNLGPDDNPCHHSAAINNAIVVWAFAARLVEGDQPKPPMVIRNHPRGPEIDSAPPATQGYAGTPPPPPSDRTSPHVRNTAPTSNPRNPEAT